MSYCKIPQRTAAQEGKGNMGNLVTTLWTNWKSVFQQELGLTMDKPHPPQKILNLGVESGRDFISLSRHWDFRACNQNDCGEMFSARRCIIILLAAHDVEGLIHFNLGLLELDDLCKKGTIFTVIIIRYILWSSFFFL